MEKEIKINTRNGKYIYGKLQGSLKNPLIIFVHGLTGYMDEHIFYNGARFFEKKGFSTFRFNLYDYWDNARKLHECDLKTHSGDLNRVAEYFQRKKVGDIYAIGHSYGGPTILLSKTKKYKALILWDPSFHLKELFKNKKYSKEFKGYFKEWSLMFFVGSKFVAEAERLADAYWRLVGKNKAPTKVILAGKGNAQFPQKHNFFGALNDPKEIIELKGAGHTFSEDGMEEKLFAETLKWLNKYRKK